MLGIIKIDCLSLSTEMARVIEDFPRKTKRLVYVAWTWLVICGFLLMSWRIKEPVCLHSPFEIIRFRNQKHWYPTGQDVHKVWLINTEETVNNSRVARSSFSTYHLASMALAKTAAKRDEKHAVMFLNLVWLILEVWRYSKSCCEFFSHTQLKFI